jgi:hypothetical protein
MNGLDQFEALAEHLVEGTFERLFRPRLHPSEVARRLARAMEDGQISSESGRSLLPNRYWVFLNPDDFVALDAGDEVLHEELLRYLQRLAAERGGYFGGRLAVTLHPRDDLTVGQLDVQAAHASHGEDMEDTQGVQVVSRSATDARRWSLQVEGRSLPLGEPVVRLGRALSNDVIVEDRRVSRRHAELRWRSGSYYLSDLGSQSGTAHNGQPLSQGQEVAVAGGDVISLADVILVVRAEVDQSGTD